MEKQPPDFESIKQVSEHGAEYWSARELSKLLTYDQWRRFEEVVNRAMIACRQIGQTVDDHFAGAGKMIKTGKGAQREVQDYFLSRFACYLVAQNGDPRKKAIAAAQAYFAVSTRENELGKLLENQQKRLELRERLGENNKALAEAARRAGVLSKDFGLFQEAGYKGLYGGLSVEEIKAKKGIEAKEDILDRMGRSELAANDFRVTQAETKLVTDRVRGAAKAVEAHHEVGWAIRGVISDMGNPLPEDLPAEPSIKPLLKEKRRREKKKLQAGQEPDEG